MPLTESLSRLGTTVTAKADEFTEIVQMALDPPSHVSEFPLQIFPERHD